MGAVRKTYPTAAYLPLLISTRTFWILLHLERAVHSFSTEEAGPFRLPRKIPDPEKKKVNHPTRSSGIEKWVLIFEFAGFSYGLVRPVNHDVRYVLSRTLVEGKKGGSPFTALQKQKAIFPISTVGSEVL